MPPRCAAPSASLPLPVDGSLMLPLPATLLRVSLGLFELVDELRDPGADGGPIGSHSVDLRADGTWTIGSTAALVVGCVVAGLGSFEEEAAPARSAQRPRSTRPGPAPVTIGPLAPWMSRRLRRLARGHGDGQVALRARMIRMLVRDPCVTAVAERLGVDRKTVRQWRDRFLARGIRGLYDEHRSGRPRTISEVTRCELISMACGRPQSYGVEHRQTWTFDELLTAFRARNPGVEISRTTVIRVLGDAELRPHRMQVWMHSQDPEFRRKATEICNLYLHPPAGSVTLCIDEKTGMQALKRKHPTKWAGCGRPGRWEFEYKRKGTRTLFAAFNTQTGHVVAEVRAKRKGRDLLQFMERVAQAYPDGVVHVVWDNLNIHLDGKEKRWTKFNKRHGNRFVFHYTPLHASWVNQVELFFSRVQKRVLRFASFESVHELADKVLGYIAHWNACERKPYRWTFRGYPLELAKSAA